MLKYEIFINPKWLKKLDNDIWEDELVPAVLKIGENRYNISLSYRGNVIRERKKKSFRIVFQKPKMINGAHEIHLNAEYSDITLSRNKLSLDLFDRIGVISPHSKHVLLCINGYCKGIYLEIESVDQFLLEKRKLPKGPIIYATNNRANFSLFTRRKELKTRLSQGYTIKNGKEEDLNDLENFIAMINTFNNDEFESEIEKVLDTKKYLKWLAGVVCTQNYDGFIHNYAIYKNGQSNLYEISPWDYDGTWGRNLHGRKLDYDYVPITGYNTLTARLLHFPKYKAMYKEVLSEIMEKDFTIEVQEPIIEELFQSIVPFSDQDPYINIDKDLLKNEKNYILDFINRRKSYLNQNLEALS